MAGVNPDGNSTISGGMERRHITCRATPQHQSYLPRCGHMSKDNRPTQAKFLCIDCGYENNAEVVGAINVLERGMSLASLWKIGAIRPFCEAETHRSDSDCYSLNAVGIPLPFRASGCRKAGWKMMPIPHRCSPQCSANRKLFHRCNCLCVSFFPRLHCFHPLTHGS